MSYLLPSVPVNHSRWVVPVATTEDSTTQNARNDTPMTEGTGTTQKAVSDAPTEKRESAKLADGATEQKTEENASRTTTSTLYDTQPLANLMRILQTRQVKSLEQGGTQECPCQSWTN